MTILDKYFADFSPSQTEKFEALKDLYTEWNEKINVISRKDIEHIYTHHVLHSLSIAAVAEFNAGMEVIDIGCGGGFPGVPLAIFYPDVQFHLVDSIGKKLKVVEAVAEAIGLTNITTQHIRAEEIKGRKFHFAVSRAVAPLKDLWQWSAPMLRKGNSAALDNGLICLKGGDLHQEISDSNVKPRMQKIYDIFPEEYFNEKFIIHVPKQ